MTNTNQVKQEIKINFCDEKLFDKIPDTSINGMESGLEYTLEQMQAALGIPDSIYQKENKAVYEKEMRLYYGKDEFNCDTNGGFSARLETHRFSLGNGFIKVGNPISPLFELPYIRKLLVDEDKKGCEIWLGWADTPIRIGLEEGIITSIYYFEYL